MPDAVPLSRPVRRVTLVIEPTTGCASCHDSGGVLSEELDAQGLWFKQAPCEDCHGSGQAVCAAVGCGQPARSLITLSGGLSYACCGHDAHTRELVALLLEASL